jgi:phosphoribosylanthranilate isomerase
MIEMRTRVKFCGMTNLADALAAASLGVDAIGLIFHDASPRNVSLAIAKNIVEAMPAFVACVGVFVDQTAATVAAILQVVPLHILQFHGSESAEFCRSFGKPYIKTIHIAAAPLAINLDLLYPDAKALLLDTQIAGVAGGSGVTFDWQHIPQMQKPFILAGGLTPENIAQAVANVQPFAVDVTTGIEKRKGFKDHTKMRQFIAALASHN